MRNDIVSKPTQFRVSVMPTPKLILSISKASTTLTTTTAAKVIPTVIVSNKDKRIVLTKEIISTKKDDSKEEEKEEEEDDDDFDIGMIHVLTHILKVPLNYAIAQALQNNSAFEYLEFKYHSNNDINWVYNIKPISKQDTVALRAVNAYVIYLSVNSDNEKAMDPTLWDVNAFKKLRRNGCVIFLANEVATYIPPKLKNFDCNITG